jgi:putative YhgA-like transposase
MVEELVREFVPEALATDLDFHTLQRVNPKFHIGRSSAQRRESDVIWRLPTRKGADVYLYILIEFQSESDWWMAVRTQVYQGLLWQQVIEEKKLKAGTQLPPLLLLVLHNGVRRWDAPAATHELIALPPDSALWPWQPHVRYYLLDMSTFSKDELARRPTLVALLFRLEQQYPREEFNELVSEVIGWFRRHEGHERLRALFAELIREGLAARGMISHNLSEITTMKSNIPKNIEDWIDYLLTKGEAEGEAKGLLKGKAEALLCLLAERFGAVTPTLRKRIHEARQPTLDRWFKRAIVATDLHSVFTPRR